MLPPRTKTVDGVIYQDNGDGTATVVGYADQPIGGVNPTYEVNQATVPSQIQQAQASAANTSADARVNQATMPAQIRAANAAATTAELGVAKAQRELGGAIITPAQREAAIAAQADAAALREIVGNLRTRFAQGPGATSGPRGLMDFFPTADNKRFDQEAQRARGYVKRALGFTGGEGNTLAEASALYNPYLPSASDLDSAAIDKITALEDLANQAERKANALLGTPPRDRDDNDAAAMPGVRMLPPGSGTPMGAAGSGATSQSQPIPPEMQAEHDAWVAQNITRATPEAYTQFRNSLNRRYGFGEVDPAAAAEYVTMNQQAAAQGGAVNPNVMPSQVPMGGVGQVLNDVGNTPMGAGLAGSADAASFGMLSALAPDQMAALREESPLGALGGQVLGSIGGTAALGRLAGAGARAVAPGLLGGGTGAQVGRNLATDMAYGGLYGSNTGQDPLTSMAMAGIGSLGGQGIGRAASGLFGGATLRPAVERLRAAGVPMSTGQMMGGQIGRFEEAMSSVPGLGGVVRNRRMEALEGGNRQVFNEAYAPVGVNPGSIGREGLEDMARARDQAYADALRGVDEPVDATLAADLTALRQRAATGLAPDRVTEFDRLFEARIAPILTTGRLTGEAFQDAVRGIKGLRSDPSTNIPGGEQALRGVLSEVEDALTQQLGRAGKADNVAKLNNANALNRNYETLRTAMPENGANGIEDGPALFTGNQLQRSARRTADNYPGPRPFGQTADDMAQVLPDRVANSGSADRLQAGDLLRMLSGVAGVGGAAGGGAGFLSGGDGGSAAQGAAGGAGLGTAAALLALLGGSRGGQAGINSLLAAERPQALKFLGNLSGRSSGLFGSGSLALTQPRQ